MALELFNIFIISHPSQSQGNSLWLNYDDSIVAEEQTEDSPLSPI